MSFEEIEKLKEKILKEYPRLSEEDIFQFECGPHLDCFNACCADVNIFLTPYDVMRMKNALDLRSDQFLSRYTIVPFDEKQKLPMPLMLMKDTDKKECHFVDQEKGCTIYDNRPWPCRMYPLGSASPSEMEGLNDEKFYFEMREDVCHGFGCEKKWKIGEWIDDQGIRPYDEFGELFKEVTLHSKLTKGWKPTPKHVEMYWMALYDLDKFRTFIFGSTFLQRFDISDNELSLLEKDDEELLRFGFKWVKVALFGEKTVPIKPEAASKFKQPVSQK